VADWKPPPVPSDAVHLKLRCAKGWAGKCSSLEERTVALGATIRAAPAKSLAYTTLVISVLLVGET